MAHNVWRKVPRIGCNDKNLLWVVRATMIPMTAIACVVASLAYNPGYLLVVAFDVVLAGCFVPLMAAVYWPGMTPNAGGWGTRAVRVAVVCVSSSQRWQQHQQQQRQHRLPCTSAAVLRLCTVSRSCCRTGMSWLHL
jgi:Na+(H+)/acetate symporter ActP